MQIICQNEDCIQSGFCDLFFVMALLPCYSWAARQTPFTDEFALSEIFGNYNAQCDCSEMKGLTTYYKSQDKQEYGELTFFKSLPGALVIERI